MEMIDSKNNSLLNEVQPDIKQTNLYRDMSGDAFSAGLSAGVYGLGIAPVMAGTVAACDVYSIIRMLEDPKYLAIIPVDILVTLVGVVVVSMVGAHALDRLKLCRTILKYRKELLNNSELAKDEFFKRTYKKMIDDSQMYSEM